MEANEPLEIAGRRIGRGEPPYLVAELSANHGGSLLKALELLDAALAAGASAAKIQTYRPETITLDASTPDFMIDGGLWHGRRLFDLYREAHTPWEWHEQIFRHARNIGLSLFSSPFDASAVDLLESLGCPAYKIASFEAVDLDLIRRVAATGKPVIISTGMIDAQEIAEAVATARHAGARQLALLHCVSAYPAPADQCNLRTMVDMGERFGLPVGLSDHTLDNATAIAGVALGACIIEKHFTLNRSGGGPDDSFSQEPEQYAQLCRDANIAWSSLGRVEYGPPSSARANVKFRRSLYFIKDLRKGDHIDIDSVRSVRPGFGLAPRHLPSIIGAKLARDVQRNTPVTIDCLEGPASLLVSE